LGEECVVQPNPFWSSRPGVVFGQVQEDAEVEMAVLERAPGSRVAVVASGGCTALSLLTRRPERVHAVDLNRWQLDLVASKRLAFERMSYGPVLALHLDELNESGGMDRMLKLGRHLFRRLVHDGNDIAELLAQEDAAGFYRTVWDDRRWWQMFYVACSRTVLGRVFIRDYVRRIPRRFPEVMHERVEHAILGSPPRHNPYLWQALTGRYGPEALPPYLQADGFEVVRDMLPRLSLCQDDMAAWLERQAAGSIDCVLLSNVTDMATIGWIGRLAEAARRALAPGGLVCLRFILPPAGDVQAALAGSLRLDPGLSEELTRKDRSLYCKPVFIYSPRRG
jgi:S-adenosylmethionine-diacylglycerol 3-amino-3-carboxypropyl transferase